MKSIAAGALTTANGERRTNLCCSHNPESITIAGIRLDRDGKLDLLTNFSRKYSLHPFKLFLSSHAKKGRLVGEAASLLRTAC